jgi:mRNA interferase MazF
LKRGEVWWATLPPPIGQRPVLLISRDAAYAIRSMVMVAEVTTRVRGIPTEVALGTAEGLPRPCAANLDSIITISKSSLRQYIGTLNPQKMALVEDAIRYALGLGS